MREEELRAKCVQPSSRRRLFAGFGCARKAQCPPWVVSNKCDVGVCVDGVAALGDEADEWVVQGMQDQRGNGDAIKDACGGGAVVVIVGAGKAGVQRGDAIVELTQRANSGGAVSIVSAREER